MLKGALTLCKAVGPVGIGHKLKLLIILDQFIDQHFRILIVDVVITGPMNVKQIALQFFGMG